MGTDKNGGLELRAFGTRSEGGGGKDVPEEERISSRKGDGRARGETHRQVSMKNKESTGPGFRRTVESRTWGTPVKQ